MFTYNITKLPFVSMTGRLTEKDGWSHTGRSMDCNLLAIVHRGECTFTINETVYPLSSGDVLLIPQNTYYKPYTEQSCEYTFFHFDGDIEQCSDQLTPPVYEAEAPAPFYGIITRDYSPLYLDYKMKTGDKAQEISLLLNKCINLRTSLAAMQRTQLSLYFAEILLYISDVYSRGTQKKEDLPASLGKILLYIQENYTKTITLDDISRYTNVSKQHCMRLFKRYMNQTINEYILDMRMKYAAYLLLHTYMNISEVTDYLGFCSVSYFSRVFKSYHGVPPKMYKE